MEMSNVTKSALLRFQLKKQSGTNRTKALAVPTISINEVPNTRTNESRSDTQVVAPESKSTKRDWEREACGQCNLKF